MGGSSQYPVNAITPPAQVTGLTATPLSSSSIGTAWTATTGASSYTVDRVARRWGPQLRTYSQITGSRPVLCIPTQWRRMGRVGRDVLESRRLPPRRPLLEDDPFKPGIRTFANVSGSLRWPLSSPTSMPSRLRMSTTESEVSLSPPPGRIWRVPRRGLFRWIYGHRNIINYLKSFNPPVI